MSKPGRDHRGQKAESDARLAFVYDVFRNGNREDYFTAELGLLTSVRQHQALESGADPISVTLGIGVLSHPGRGRQYSFVLIGSPPPTVPAALRWQVERDYGVLSGRTIKPVALPDRDRQCPCASGSTFAACCAGRMSTFGPG
jgi:hypothetical protein